MEHIKRENYTNNLLGQFCNKTRGMPIYGIGTEANGKEVSKPFNVSIYNWTKSPQKDIKYTIMIIN
jgi:hypothetical protein